MGIPKRWSNTTPEDNDPQPIELNTANVSEPSLEEKVANAIYAHFAQKEELETWEEADDFEPEEEDLLPFSKYEFANIQPEYVEGDPYQPRQQAQEAPQEEIAAKEGPNPSPQEETPSGASE